MIDLHSHILHGIDDGSADLAQSLEMARIAVAEGTTVMACTPHDLPGVYQPGPSLTRSKTDELRDALQDAGIALELVEAAEAHIRPDFVERLRAGDILGYGSTKAVLVEAPFHILPPRLEHLLSDIVTAGYQPVFAHPERLRWTAGGLTLLRRLVASGVAMQITAGSFFGEFGSHAERLSRVLLSEGLVQVVASDAHDPLKRRPGLAAARRLVERELGARHAIAIFDEAPRRLLNRI